ncbi:unnamed protein product [Didymodactylos carnosus]|uniref:Uncharacterized protein n=1 Tax=Didymodactylos carnosus TaxID=1234261 RepID=A0A815EQS1_9BILA|nr:unnamed protein product [Didymodactylos carnosus]CAF1433466.1 unnamed protein product [Didymodactylos carnosus]CAF4156670.1 unnamed protein product [Didymodactylos carnosus]CAF4231193.1 unnamed protein product [Didymodactylos carnosus]
MFNTLTFHLGVSQGKMLYPFEQVLVMRDAISFEQFSSEGRPGKDCYGHFGGAVLFDLFNRQFPECIMIDYLHTTLLRQTKTMLMHLSNNLRPTERVLLDAQLTEQKFPHFFNRTVRGISQLAHVKGTELRNLLLYSIIPTFISFFSPNLIYFIALFSCGVCLLHGPPLENISTSSRSRLSSILMKEYMSTSKKKDF